MEHTKISSPQTNAATPTARSKAAASSVMDGHAPPDASGFLALMSALSEVEGESLSKTPLELSQGDTTSLVAEGGDLDSALVLAQSEDSEGTQAMAAWQGLLGQGAVALGQIAVDLKGLRPADAQSPLSKTAGDLAQGVQTIAKSGTSLPGANSSLQSLVQETQMLDTAADRRTADTTAFSETTGRAMGRSRPAWATNEANVRSLEGGLKKMADVGSALSSSSSGLSAPASGAASSVGERVLSVGMAASYIFQGGRGEAPAMPGINYADEFASAEPLGAGPLTSGFAEMRQGASGGGQAGSGETWSGGASQGLEMREASSVELGGSLPEAAFALPEDQLTEQVTYWINQKSQNAELKLGAEGQEVEVSVSLTGNEANITFRSDEEQTREMLDQSLAELKELLRSEGLVLAGVTVEKSGRDMAGGHQSGNPAAREGARQAKVAAVGKPDLAPQQPAGRGVSEGSVDVFV